MQHLRTKRPRFGAEGSAKRPRKHISFSRDGNKVRFVKPPPRSMNRRYWFTETESVVKKGVSFEIEPDINVSVDVGCRMQLTSIASQSSSFLHASPGGDAVGKKRHGSSTRVFLEVKVGPSLGLLGGARGSSRWYTVASVNEGHVEKTRVILPPGTYMLRCVGERPIQIFAQAWDLETKLD
ncbi:hypothetical protein DQ04_00621070 [Trypanosoma grayi]|uniref:hypothetical protein n=1 Tax=Trypanosoma grayi TaxID=71804 RepID=UPI0004F40144|nr:hypothetical protein DQ04_00621070 [Trypanosoma grayi]KEG14098.1 hypothetical protein DQ04_00621070 [Trypanosoma grayi]